MSERVLILIWINPGIDDVAQVYSLHAMLASVVAVKAGCMAGSMLLPTHTYA